MDSSKSGSRLLLTDQTITNFHIPFRKYVHIVLICINNLQIIAREKGFESDWQPYSYLEVNVPVEGSLNTSLKIHVRKNVLCRHLKYRFLRREN